MSKKFSHLDDDNNPSMVDISSKPESKRIAKGYAKVILNNEILHLSYYTSGCYNYFDLKKLLKLF